jgi:transcriptional regulator
VHPSRAFHQADPVLLAELVSQRGLALVVGVGGRQGGAGASPLAAHAPVLLDRSPDGGWRLRFHLSRGNALAASLQDGDAVLAVVTGPEAYVSPDWYGLEDQVPTWNYQAVEMAGPVRRLDVAATTAMMDDLSAAFEARLAPKLPWTRQKMTPGRFEAMLSGILGYEMRIERFEGTWKLGQHKPDQARTAVSEALEAQGQPEMARLVRP